MARTPCDAPEVSRRCIRFGQLGVQTPDSLSPGCKAMELRRKLKEEAYPLIFSSQWIENAVDHGGDDEDEDKDVGHCRSL